MTARSKAVLKTYFLRGLRPTQSQYGDLIDSFTDTGDGGKVYVSATDTTVKVLNSALLTSTALSKTIGSPGGNETLTLDVNLATNSGLENSSGLRVKTQSDGGIQRTANGLSLAINDMNALALTPSTDYLPFYQNSGGVQAKILVSTLLNNVQIRRSIFSASGTFTTPSNITTSTVFEIILIGGGGSGSNYTGSTGSSGASGGTCWAWVSGLAPSTGYNVVIGAGGVAQGTNNTAGNAGSNTTITINGITYIATGGEGGVVGTVNAALGGTATNGDINANGNPGPGGGDATYVPSGGASFLGGAGAASGGTAVNGSGGAATSAAELSGAGGSGFVIIRWVS